MHYHKDSEHQITFPRTIIASLGQIAFWPLTNLLAIFIITIALFLPTSVYLAATNAKALTNLWNQSAEITLFLKKDIPANKITELTQNLSANKNIAEVTYIAPEDGLKQFATTADFGAMLTDLKQNPLPPVILVQPQLFNLSEISVAKLFTDLSNLPEVAQAKIDLDWIKLSYEFLYLGERIFKILLVLLVIGAITTITFTTYFASRFSAHKMHHANNSVLVCHGFWYGLLGSGGTLILLKVFFHLLKNNHLQLLQLNWRASVIVVGGSVLLGILSGLL